MKIKFVALAALLALSAGSVFAAPAPVVKVMHIEWDALTTDDGALGSFVAKKQTAHDSYFNFSLDNTYNFFTTAVADNDAHSTMINNIAKLQKSVAPNIWNTVSSYTFGNTSTEHNFGVQLAGDYRMEVSGYSGGTATAHGTIHTRITEVTPAVPEPETYALLLAGLGVMGFLARRRKLA